MNYDYDVSVGYAGQLRTYRFGEDKVTTHRMTEVSSMDGVVVVIAERPQGSEDTIVVHVLAVDGFDFSPVRGIFS